MTDPTEARDRVRRKLAGEPPASIYGTEDAVESLGLYRDDVTVIVAESLREHPQNEIPLYVKLSGFFEYASSVPTDNRDWLEGFVRHLNEVAELVGSTTRFEVEELVRSTVRFKVSDGDLAKRMPKIELQDSKQ